MNLKVGKSFSTDKGTYVVKKEIRYKGSKIYYIEGTRKGFRHAHYEVGGDINGTMFEKLDQAKALIDENRTKNGRTK